MGVVYLHFISSVGPAALLIFGMEINTGISVGHGFYISFKFKIFEIMLMHIAIIKKMGCFAMHYDHSAVCTKCSRIVPNLSLIHISEPTRRTPISYAVF